MLQPAAGRCPSVVVRARWWCRRVPAGRGIFVVAVGAREGMLGLGRESAGEYYDCNRSV